MDIRVNMPEEIEKLYNTNPVVKNGTHIGL